MILISLANNGIAQFITVTLIFVVVLAITYFTTRWVGTYQKKQISRGNIKVVESVRISSSKVLEIVNVGSKYFLIAVCKDTVTNIGEVNGDELDLLNDTAEQENFGSVFNRFKVVRKGDITEKEEEDRSYEKE